VLLTAVAGGRLFVIAVLLTAVTHGGLSIVVLLSLMAAVGTVPASWSVADLGNTVAGNDGIKIIVLAHLFDVKVVDKVVVIIMLRLVAA
jgi:hypothetical protein